MQFNTADLCDSYHDKVKVLEKGLFSFGGEERCFGPIKTIMLEEENSALRDLLKTEGHGRIVVVDVKGAYCAVVGDTLMGFAAQHNWAGIIVNGYVRDIDNCAHIRVGLWALGTCPRKCQKRVQSKEGETLSFLGVSFTDEHYLYADSDGIIVSEENLLS